jgi:hypothetical protein
VKVFGVIRTAVAFVPRRWWARPPYLPIPDEALVRFRMETAYGSPAAKPPRGDLGLFLRWTVAMRQLHRSLSRRR